MCLRSSWSSSDTSRLDKGAVDQVNAFAKVLPRAPCVAAPMDVLRHLVSGDKYRFKDPTTGTDLDLTYITERIIAMVRP